MATQARVRLLVGGGATVVLAAVALLVPVEPRFPPAWQSPTQAAERAERDVPTLGLLWGKVRGWSRVGTGWTVLWQPSHGMWLVSAWVPDGPGEIRWRIDAAPWLPGVRLSGAAAEVLTGLTGGVEQARERLGRRDWQVGESRLLGALPAGGELPSAGLLRRPVVLAVLVGLLLAGAVSRHLVPGVPGRGWRYSVVSVVLLLFATLPELPALAPMTFQPGVRPWVAELAFGTAAVLLLGALMYAGQRFPATAGSPPVGWLPLALAVGTLAGRFEPAIWLVNVAGLTLRLPVLVGLAVLAGWLAGIAGSGLRELLRFSAFARVVGLSLLGMAGVGFGGAWTGVTLAVVSAAAVERGWGTWMGMGVVWGWFFGSLWVVARWETALWDALVFVLLGCGVVAVAHLAREHRSATSESPALP
ncbi:MAG: hypothetical protein A2Y78_02315 [Acidobacteria bacterium RBG_13_68_16]|nr:MAG: hypothetical protein A2Y78_02315 [Acidobacteria bacterium RBG_13_68_16]